MKVLTTYKEAVVCDITRTSSGVNVKFSGKPTVGIVKADFTHYWVIPDQPTNEPMQRIEGKYCRHVLQQFIRSHNITVPFPFVGL